MKAQVPQLSEFSPPIFKPKVDKQKQKGKGEGGQKRQESIKDEKYPTHKTAAGAEAYLQFHSPPQKPGRNQGTCVYTKDLLESHYHIVVGL